MMRRLGVLALVSALVGGIAPASAQAGSGGAELPGEFILLDFTAFVDAEGVVWVKVHPQIPWGPTPPHDYYSDFVGILVNNLGAPPEEARFVGFQTHAGVDETFAQTGQTFTGPAEAYLMDDGAILFNTRLVWAEGDLEVSLFSAFLPTEDGTRVPSESHHTVRGSEMDETDDPLHFDGETPVYDLQTGTAMETVVVTTTVAETTTTSRPATTTVTTTTIPATTERLRTTTTGGGCWWCWGSVALFLAVLLCALWVWLKTHEWWTCWLPWFIVIFVWMPFLLAGLWWWRPAWWWVPLLAWFPLVGGYWWWWARHRSWWKKWHVYFVVGYLGLLGAGMVVVGAPEWGLLLPLFWVPWIAFYFWFRGARQPWFRPWMWGLGAGFVVWVFVWVAVLTPWWAWWLPVVMVPFVWWWLAGHGHSWQELRGPKWCWSIPFALLPFFAWWIPIWQPWWCVAIVVFLVFHLSCAVFTHYRTQEWWTWWLVWVIVLFAWVPFLFAWLVFFRPGWWFWALVPWLVVVPVACWWWARRRAWWREWMWYPVLGYLVLAAAISYTVGAPEWGLLYPVFWLPWVGLWMWYRARLQPWWRSWMFGLVGLFAAWVLVWVGWLTPFWGWWFPIFLLPFLGWWFVDHGYDFALFHSKSCFVLPWCLVVWFAYMIELYCVTGL